MMRKRKGFAPVKGAANGILAGLAAAYAMKQVQALWSKLERSRQEREGTAVRETGEPPAEQPIPQPDDQPSSQLATVLTKKLTASELTPQQKGFAVPAVHYGFGGFLGALYGLATEFWPGLSWGRGLPYGAAAWLLADEVSLPVLQLAGPPDEYPLSTHMQSLAAHVAYGLTLDLCGRVFRRVL